MKLSKDPKLTLSELVKLPLGIKLQKGNDMSIDVEVVKVSDEETKVVITLIKPKLNRKEIVAMCHEFIRKDPSLLLDIFQINDDADKAKPDKKRSFSDVSTDYPNLAREIVISKHVGQMNYEMVGQ